MLHWLEKMFIPKYREILLSDSYFGKANKGRFNPAGEQVVIRSRRDIPYDAGEIQEMVAAHFGDCIDRSPQFVNGVTVGGREILICVKPGAFVNVKKLIKLLK